MIRKFFIGTAMGAVFIVGVLFTVIFPVVAALYASEHYGPLAAAGTLFVSACATIGAMYAVFD